MHHRHIINRNEPLFCIETSGEDRAWFSSDSEERYLNNRDRPDMDPVYLDPDYVHYKFNHWGYRTDELDTYQEDQYFIAMGCSYTVGEGLAKQDRWSDRITEHTGIPNMNLGISGSGLDVYLINTMHLIQCDFIPRPKFVVLQHPEISRQQGWYQQDISPFSEIKENSFGHLSMIHYELTKKLHPRDTRRDITQVINAAYHTEMFQHYWNSIDVPTIHWTFTGDAEVLKDYTTVKIHSIPGDYPDMDWAGDVARDMAHDDRLANNTVAEQLVEEYNLR